MASGLVIILDFLLHVALRCARRPATRLKHLAADRREAGAPFGV
jgi:hypothetical protein